VVSFYLGRLIYRIKIKKTCLISRSCFGIVLEIFLIIETKKKKNKNMKRNEKLKVIWLCNGYYYNVKWLCNGYYNVKWGRGHQLNCDDYYCDWQYATCRYCFYFEDWILHECFAEFFFFYLFILFFFFFFFLTWLPMDFRSSLSFIQVIICIDYIYI
jgi:hypothetical protein